MGRARWLGAVLALIATGALALPPAGAQSVPVPAFRSATEYEGAAALGLALRQLGTTKRVLMIAAHPDDEQTQLLSELALRQGAAVGYLSLTRGEGGQNGIGPELQAGLGILRSEELLAARRLDGAQQFFTRAIDFGFSKEAEEAFRFWPHEEILGDVVAVVRSFRPDLIISVFTGTPLDGHGQHQAAGILAREAFEAAADPHRYPEQLSAGVRPHAATHFYQIVRGFDEEPSVTLATGDLDPLLGRSYFQVAMASRSRHRSQDMGRPESPGPNPAGLVREHTRAAAGVGAQLFAGVDTTLTARVRTRLGDSTEPDALRLRNLVTAYQATIDDARRVLNPLLPDQVVYFLVEASKMLDQLLAGVNSLEGEGAELGLHFEHQRTILDDALRRAARVEFEVIASEERLVPGESFDLALRLWNGGSMTIEPSALEPRLPIGWSAEPLDEIPDRVAPGSVLTRRFRVTVAPDETPTLPYYLEAPTEGAFYRWPEERAMHAHPFQPDIIQGWARFSVQGAPIESLEGAVRIGVDPRSGEFRRPVRVVPEVSVLLEPELAVLPLDRRAQPLKIAVQVESEAPAGVAGSLALEMPPGWRVEPASLPIRFEQAGQRERLELTLFAPESLAPGRVHFDLSFLAEDGRRFGMGAELIDYPHVRPRPLYRPATFALEVVDVALPEGARIGYVAALGDPVPRALAPLGLDLTLLGPDEIASAPLHDFDLIVIGSRAYEGRPELGTFRQRLLDYVAGGGTMLVQYQQYPYLEAGIAPYPVSIARPHDRVTDEGAPIRLLEPAHPIFTTPNRITPVDFDGWVQERGLYFLNTWDDRYTPLLEMADPGEEPTRGALLVADYGEGRYLYTGLAFFRQLAAGVPGAYRLMANLLAWGVE